MSSLKKIIEEENIRNPEYAEINDKYAFVLPLGLTGKGIDVTLDFLLDIIKKQGKGVHQFFLLAEMLGYKEKVNTLLTAWNKKDK